MPPPLNYRLGTAGGSSVAFPADPASLVFARLAQMLRDGLKGCTVRAWDDPASDMTPAGSDGPPWVRMTPKPGPGKPYCRGPGGVVHRTPLVVEFETSTPGTRVSDSAAFWGQIVRAIYPGPALDSQLNALGVMRVDLNQPAWGAPPKATAEASTPRCEGSGSITLMLYTRTVQ